MKRKIKQNCDIFLLFQYFYNLASNKNKDFLFPETERAPIYYWFTPQMLSMAGTEPSQSSGPGIQYRSPMWAAGI